MTQVFCITIIPSTYIYTYILTLLFPACVNLRVSFPRGIASEIRESGITLLPEGSLQWGMVYAANRNCLTISYYLQIFIAKILEHLPVLSRKLIFVISLCSCGSEIIKRGLPVQHVTFLYMNGVIKVVNFVPSVFYELILSHWNTCSGMLTLYYLLLNEGCFGTKSGAYFSSQ